MGGADFLQQHELENERMQLELDCLQVVYKHGLEGTATILASQLGLSKEWKILREQIEDKE